MSKIFEVVYQEKGQSERVSYARGSSLVNVAIALANYGFDPRMIRETTEKDMENAKHFAKSLNAHIANDFPRWFL